MLITSMSHERSTTTKFYETLSPENLAAVCKAFRINPAKLGRTEEPVNPSERKPGNRQHRPRRKPYRARKPAKQAQEGDNRQ